LGIMPIRRASTSDVETVRKIRLQALANEPECFGVSLEQERQRSLSEWRLNVIRDTWLLAYDPSPVAVVAFFPGDLYPDGNPQLGAMWVNPGSRGVSLARQLDAAVVRQARQQGFTGLGLWVTATNLEVVPVYESLGYALTGASKPSPRDSAVLMYRMCKAIDMTFTSAIPWRQPIASQ
jgi:GNAT superfamily N-acetyltransferase